MRRGRSEVNPYELALLAYDDTQVWATTHEVTIRNLQGVDVP